MIYLHCKRSEFLSTLNCIKTSKTCVVHIIYTRSRIDSLCCIHNTLYLKLFILRWQSSLMCGLKIQNLQSPRQIYTTYIMGLQCLAKNTSVVSHLYPLVVGSIIIGYWICIQKYCMSCQGIQYFRIQIQ